jgi:UDP-N-acetylmuramate: L-alanyl-gamma-D-glutamyl-meso-diaminopimelate ligase
VDQLALKPDLFVVGNVVSRARDQQGHPKYPLIEAILDQGLPYTSGPQWLGEHLLHHPQNPYHVLAVAGTHGKTTTSSMLAWILEHAGLEPGFLIGGVPLNFKTSARLGRGGNPSKKTQDRPLFVIEADEYDSAFFDKRSKFVHYRPRTAVLNNLEFDHADIFDSIADIQRQFHHLLRTVPANGRVIYNAKEASLAKVLEMGCWSEKEGFAISNPSSTPTHPAPAWSAKGAQHSFDVLQQLSPAGHLEWALSGEHNQMNALASIAAAHHVGVSVAQSIEALRVFGNVKRRMELVGSAVLKGGGEAVRVYDDFAHHPTAIQTTLDGLRHQLDLHHQSNAPQARILCVFEPRSNTMKLGSMSELLPESLKASDLSFCLTQGLDWDAQGALKPLGAKAFCAPSVPDLVSLVMSHVKAGDHIVCMSNGGFGGIHRLLLEALTRT